MCRHPYGRSPTYALTALRNLTPNPKSGVCANHDLRPFKPKVLTLVTPDFENIHTNASFLYAF